MGGQRIVSWLGVLAGLCFLAGTAAALAWARIVHLPSYVVKDDFTASMSEHGHTEVFAADAWFVVIGLVVGLVLGAVAWSWFKSVGAPVAAIATASGLIAGGVCWALGQTWGPGAFADRLAHASPGDQVPIAFQLHAPIALVAWGLAAVVPTLLASALGPEVRPWRAGGVRGRQDDPATPEAATRA